MSALVPWVYDDGGRAAAGFKGSVGDCVVRAIAIASGLPYRQVYDGLYAAGKIVKAEKVARRARGWSEKFDASPRTGVHHDVYRPFLEGLGFEWVATMGIGSGCRVHLMPDELPGGPLVVRLSKHVAAVVDGVLRDTYDCSRGGTRCVYGFWHQAEWREIAAWQERMELR